MGRRAKKVVRTRDADASQRALLEAGARLFAEKGYEAATLEDLAAAAGLTKAMVRYHFEDKANFYRAVVWESIDHIAEAVETVRDADLEPKLKLTRYVAVLAEAIRERPHMGGMLSSGAAPGTLAKDDELVENLLRLFMATKAVLMEGQRKGVFRKLDPHLFHFWLVGAIIYFVATQRFRDEMTFKPSYRGAEPRFDAFVRLLQHTALKSAAPD